MPPPAAKEAPLLTSDGALLIARRDLVSGFVSHPDKTIVLSKPSLA